MVLKILLVEDNQHDWIAFRRTLERSEVPCEITHCVRAEEALAILDKCLKQAVDCPFDLVVIDHKLPGMSGLNLCKTLLARALSLPLILLTGQGSEMIAVEALKLGVKDYIVKDAEQGYLDLLPIVLPEVVQQHEDRVVRSKMEVQLKAYAEHLEQMVDEKVQELEQERAKAIQMDKLASLGQMATGIVHELKQPLTAISFDADYLKTVAQKILQEKRPLDTMVSAKDLYDIGQELIDDVARCNRIVNHLRTFARTSEGHPTPTDLNVPIANCFVLVETRLRDHNIAISQNLTPNLPSIMADAHRLEQVFLNLIANAEYAMEKRASHPPAASTRYQKILEIHTYTEADSVIATIRDNGCGMSDEVQAHIFEPFFTTKPEGIGTGLGLSISYGIVTEFGGEITFESVENEGTIFILRFPIAEAVRNE